MTKRITIQVDVQESNVEQVQILIEQFKANLDFSVAEYDPEYEFNVVVDNVREAF